MQILSKYQQINNWLQSVRANSSTWSSKLSECLQEENSGKKDNKKKTGAKKEPAKKEEKKRKLKLLAIHGYRQNAKTFKEKLGSFRKLINKYAELEFVTAPHLIPPTSEEDQVGILFSDPNWFYEVLASRKNKMVGGLVNPIKHLMLMKILKLMLASKRVLT